VELRIDEWAPVVDFVFCVMREEMRLERGFGAEREIAGLVRGGGGKGGVGVAGPEVVS
jgi:hypothetical protein